MGFIRHSLQLSPDKPLKLAACGEGRPLTISKCMQVHVGAGSSKETLDPQTVWGNGSQIGARGLGGLEFEEVREP